MITVSILESSVNSNDKIWHDDDSIVINGVKYNFKKTKDFQFQSPSGHISFVQRDANGVLQASIYKYVVKGYDVSSPVWSDTVIVTEEIDVTEKYVAEELTEEELIDNELAEVDAEIQALRQSVIDEIIDERLGVSND